MAYFLPKDVVTVSGTVVYRKMGKIDKDFKVTTTPFRFESSTVSVGLNTIPDKTQAYMLDLEHKLLQDDDFSVTAGAGGFLAAVNSDSSGQAGEVVKNIASFVTSVVPLIGALGVADTEFSKLESSYREELKEIAANPLLKARFRDLDPASAFYIIKNRSGREVWTFMVLLDQKIAEFKDTRRAIQTTGSTGGKAAMDLAQMRLGFMREVEPSLFAERESVRANFEAGLAAFKLDQKIGTTDASIPFNVVFELAELPPGDAIRPGMQESEVAAALKSHSKALELWQLGRVVVTATGLVTQAAAADKAPSAGDLVVHYRRTTPLLMATYTLANLPQGENSKDVDLVTKVVDKTIRYVMHPDSPAVSVAFEQKAFAQRRLALTMDAKGELTKLERKAGSSLKAATGAAATAAKDSIINLTGAFDAARKIAQTRRDIKLDDIKGEVSKLTEQKNLLDQKIALDGLNASEEIIKQKKVLDARLATRQAEINAINTEATQQLKGLEDELKLLNAQSSLDAGSANLQLLLGQKRMEAELATLKAQLDVDKVRTTVGDLTTINELKSQVELVRQQLELLKIQRDLEKERSVP